jgi:hypothetical protein
MDKLSRVGKRKARSLSTRSVPGVVRSKAQYVQDESEVPTGFNAKTSLASGTIKERS